MKIDAVSLYYLAMPEILDIGDGSQDALVVKIEAGPYIGWGECEASPLVSIASWVCPMSHAACKPLRQSIVGQRIENPDDIRRIGEEVRQNSFDLLQADHTLSGIDIALWDLLGKMRSEPVYRLLGYAHAWPKLPYASQLFGQTPHETFEKAAGVRKAGYHAVKFGWGPYGHGDVAADEDQVHAARDGFGDGYLMIDAGTVWAEDVEKAGLRMRSLADVRAYWLEEPFHSGALDAYRLLAERKTGVPLAAGEGSHNVYGARHLIDYGNVGFIQIDTGRVGGITTAYQIARHAEHKKVQYVNHTFTSNLALAASLQPFLGMQEHVICEYPVELKPLGADLTIQKILPGPDGMIRVPDAPGLGVEPDPASLRKYIQDVEIVVNGTVLYSTPPLFLGT